MVRKKVIDEGNFPAYLSNVTDYSPAVLKRIIPDAEHVTYLTELFSTVLDCKWAKSFSRLQVPGPVNGTKLPKAEKKSKSRRGSNVSDDLDIEDDEILPATNQFDRVYSGLEWLMLIKTKGDRLRHCGELHIYNFPLVVASASMCWAVLYGCFNCVLSAAAGCAFVLYHLRADVLPSIWFHCVGCKH